MCVRGHWARRLDEATSRKKIKIKTCLNDGAAQRTLRASVLADFAVCCATVVLGGNILLRSIVQQ